MNVKLSRVYSGPHGTFGVLMIDYEPPALVTLEPPYKNNQRDISCIPAGWYVCNRSEYQSKSMIKKAEPAVATFEVTNVPGRSGIKFHWGNTIEDTLGCVMVGTWFGLIESIPGIAYSKPAFEKFMSRMHGVNEFDLEIVGVCGTVKNRRDDCFDPSTGKER